VQCVACARPLLAPRSQLLACTAFKNRPTERLLSEKKIEDRATQRVMSLVAGHATAAQAERLAGLPIPLIIYSCLRSSLKTRLNPPMLPIANARPWSVSTLAAAIMPQLIRPELTPVRVNQPTASERSTSGSSREPTGPTSRDPPSLPQLLNPPHGRCYLRGGCPNITKLPPRGDYHKEPSSRPLEPKNPVLYRYRRSPVRGPFLADGVSRC
jgi:hypothetical protein